MDISSCSYVCSFESIAIVTDFKSQIVYDSSSLIMPVLDHQGIDTDLGAFLRPESHDNKGLALNEPAV